MRSRVGPYSHIHVETNAAQGRGAFRRHGQDGTDPGGARTARCPAERSIAAHRTAVTRFPSRDPAGAGQIKATRTGACYRLHVAEEELYAAIEQLRGAGARILSVSQVKATLEEFFLNLVEADRAQAAAVEVSGK